MTRTHKSKHARDSDMSEEGINRRLKELGQLYRLGQSLRKAEYIGKVRNVREERGKYGPGETKKSM